MWRCRFIDEREEIYFEMCFECLDYVQKYICILSKPYIHFLSAEWIDSELHDFYKRLNHTWTMLKND